MLGVARRLFVVGFILFVSAPALQAQVEAEAQAEAGAEAPIVVGARVRINGPTGMTAGTLARLTSDSLWIADPGTGRLTPFALSRTPTVEVWAGRHRSFLKSAGLGLLVGLLGGAFLGAMTYNSSDNGFIINSRGEAALAAGVLGAAPGLVIGGLYGLVPRDRWEEAPVPAPVAAPEPERTTAPAQRRSSARETRVTSSLADSRSEPSRFATS